MLINAFENVSNKKENKLNISAVVAAVCHMTTPPPPIRAPLK